MLNKIKTWISKNEETLWCAAGLMTTVAIAMISWKLGRLEGMFETYESWRKIAEKED